MGSISTRGQAFLAGFDATLANGQDCDVLKPAERVKETSPLGADLRRKIPFCAG
jgi:hypothetical protein